MSICVWLHACVLDCLRVRGCVQPACMCMYVHEVRVGGGYVEGVAARSWKVLKVGVLVVVGGGSYLAGCKKMPPGLLMEETGISSETSIVPACH